MCSEATRRSTTDALLDRTRAIVVLKSRLRPRFLSRRSVSGTDLSTKGEGLALRSPLPSPSRALALISFGTDPLVNMTSHTICAIHARIFRREKRNDAAHRKNSHKIKTAPFRIASNRPKVILIIMSAEEEAKTTTEDPKKEEEEEKAEAPKEEESTATFEPVVSAGCRSSLSAPV